MPLRPMLFLTLFAAVLFAILLVANRARADDDTPDDEAAAFEPEPPVRLGVSVFGETRVGAPGHLIGALGTLTVPFDRAAEGARASPPPHENPPITRAIAANAVRAAYRVAGIATDAALEDLARRARLSALLPEARVRALRRTGTTDALNLAVSGGTSARDQVVDDLWLEGRLSWRFDRLLFASEEVALNRSRLARSGARARLATRVLAALFAWQRAFLEGRAATLGSLEAYEAELRLGEAEATLEILTGGWFAKWRGAAALDAARPPP